MHSGSKVSHYGPIFLSVFLFATSVIAKGQSAEDPDDSFLNPQAEVDAVEPGIEEENQDAGDAGPGNRKKIRNHHLQGVVSMLVGTGWFMVAPYDKNDPEKMCQVSEENPNEGEPFCTGRSGFYMDFIGGFGVLPGIELYAIFRLGMERPGGDLENQPKTRQIGAGIRVYSPKDGFFKIGFGIAPLFDFSDHGGGASIGKDFVIHVPLQAQFDFNRWVGTYIQVAPNFSFVSEFRLELTGGIGIQGRFI